MRMLLVQQMHAKAFPRIVALRAYLPDPRLMRVLMSNGKATSFLLSERDLGVHSTKKRIT